MIDNSKKVFLYLYPISEYFEDIIENGSRLWFNRTHPYPEYDDTGLSLGEVEAIEKRLGDERDREYQLYKPEFRELYKIVLNQCIDQRYRHQGYQVTYALFKDHSPSEVITLDPKDKIIFTEIDFKTHIASQPQLELGPNVIQHERGRMQYPCSDLILDQLSSVSELRVAGFHIWDCVEKMAKRAYERGISTLVDEDLTELLSSSMANPAFRTDIYPSFDPHLHPLGERFFHDLMECRKGVPWLWQDY